MLLWLPEESRTPVRIDFQVSNSCLGFCSCSRSLMGCVVGGKMSVHSLGGYGKDTVGRQRFCSISSIVLPRCSRDQYRSIHSAYKVADRVLSPVISTNLAVFRARHTSQTATPSTSSRPAHFEPADQRTLPAIRPNEYDMKKLKLKEFQLCVGFMIAMRRQPRRLPRLSSSRRATSQGGAGVAGVAGYSRRRIC